MKLNLISVWKEIKGFPLEDGKISEVSLGEWDKTLSQNLNLNLTSIWNGNCEDFYVKITISIYLLMIRKT